MVGSVLLNDGVTTDRAFEARGLTDRKGILVNRYLANLLLLITFPAPEAGPGGGGDGGPLWARCRAGVCGRS